METCKVLIYNLSKDITPNKLQTYLIRFGALRIIDITKEYIAIEF